MGSGTKIIGLGDWLGDYQDEYCCCPKKRLYSEAFTADDLDA